MENIPEWLALFPQLAPGIVLGAIAGVVLGIARPGEHLEGVQAWQFGGVGAVLGALGWFVLIGLA